MTANAMSLVAYQANQRQKTIDAIEAAERAIEAELDEHRYYPQNGGRLSKLEVLRRAGVSPQTLKNPTHKETAAALGRWLSRIKKTALTTGAEAENVKAGRIEALEQRLVQMAVHYDRFKLEYNELLHRCESLEAEVTRLTAALVEAIKGDTVVPLDRKR
jgi:chromosome segregation ATPase